MATQMIVTILIGAWSGVYLDDYFSTNRPYFTIFLSLFGVTGAMLVIIREITKDQKREEQEDGK